ncbi:MAG: TRAP transporter large permease [Chloroflexota bacterium]
MEASAALLLITLGLFFAINIPVAFAIALSCLVFLVTQGGIPIQTLVQRTVNGTDSFPLLAIPFFILAGDLMDKAGITRRIFKLASALVGHMTGGLAQVNIVTEMLLSGLSGSSVADAAALSKVLAPAMEKSGYKRSFGAAVCASAATLGPIIPPSIGMIIYSAMTGASVGRLFLAGIGVGLAMMVAMMVVAYVIAKRRGYGCTGESFSWVRVWEEFKTAFLALLMLPIIMVGIRFGIFTATEAAAVAAVYAGAVGLFAYREIAPKDLSGILVESAVGTATIGLIMAAATPFGWLLTWERLPQVITEWVVTASDNPVVILMMLNVFLLILGTLMDSVPVMVMLIPILLPIITNVGVDPVHFGLVLLVNLMIGGLTPPYGILLFTVSGITKVPVMEVVKEALPFMAAILIVLVLVTYVPAVSLFLPNLLMGNVK